MKRPKKIDIEKWPFRKWKNTSKKSIWIKIIEEKKYFKNMSEKYLNYLKEEEERNFIEVQHNKRILKNEIKNNLLNLYKTITWKMQ